MSVGGTNHVGNVNQYALRIQYSTKLSPLRYHQKRCAPISKIASTSRFVGTMRAALEAVAGFLSKYGAVDESAGASPLSTLPIRCSPVSPRPFLAPLAAKQACSLTI